VLFNASLGQRPRFKEFKDPVLKGRLRFARDESRFQRCEHLADEASSGVARRLKLIIAPLALCGCGALAFVLQIS
jgi:hypothetical protein